MLELLRCGAFLYFHHQAHAARRPFFWWWLFHDFVCYHILASGNLYKLYLINSWVRCFVSRRYFYILSSFVSYFSLICPITSFESFWTNRFLTPSAFPSLSPISIPSYLASLLVVENFSWTPYLSTSPSGVVITTLTPPLCWADEPSICTVHRSTLLVRLPSSRRVNSTMKSAKAYALMAILGWYSMPKDLINSVLIKSFGLILLNLEFICVIGTVPS